MNVYEVCLTFTEPLLGTAPLDAEIYKNYIADKKAELADEEIETLREDKGMTGFHADENGPFIYNYMLKGFFKDACSMLRRVEGTQSAKLTAFKKVIDGTVFITPRRLHLIMPSALTVLQRPLRAQTMQGERVALVSSEMAPVGTYVDFRLTVLDTKSVNSGQLREWFDYGSLRGLGQWRNAQYGTFDYDIHLVDSFSAGIEILAETGEPVAAMAARSIA